MTMNEVRQRIIERMRQLTSNPNILKACEQALDAIEKNQTEDFVSAKQFAEKVLNQSEKEELERVMNAYRKEFFKP